MSEIVPTFHGEVQLASWSESHNGGAKVVLWLADPSDLDAFRALTLRKGNTAGQRFVCAMVEIGDDELPVAPPADLAPPPKGGALAKLAALWCGQETFHRWLRSIGCICKGPDDAAECIRQTCGIASRAELDNDPAAAKLFQDKIRAPYMRQMQAAHA